MIPIALVTKIDPYVVRTSYSLAARVLYSGNATQSAMVALPSLKSIEGEKHKIA